MVVVPHCSIAVHWIQRTVIKLTKFLRTMASELSTGQCLLDVEESVGDADWKRLTVAVLGHDGGCPGAIFSWTACVDDLCPVHLSDKEGSGWFPQQMRFTDAKDSNDGGETDGMDIDLFDFDEAGSEAGVDQRKDDVEDAVQPTPSELSGEVAPSLDSEAPVEQVEDEVSEDGEVVSGSPPLSEEEQVRVTVLFIAMLLICLFSISVVFVEYFVSRLIS